MRNLLSAGFVRLWKSKMLWAFCGAMGATTLSAVWTRYSEGVRYGYHSSLDSVFITYVLFIAVFIPLVCTLFVGVEHADGTIRNKLIVGHSKESVYLSNLILCCVASLIICTFAVAPGLCAGLPLLGGFAMGTTRAVLFFLAVYTLALVWAALSNLLAMLVSRRAIAIVTVVLVVLALVLIGVYLEGRLEAPPTLQGYELSASGELVLSEPRPNPQYLPEGPVRGAFQFLCDFTPGGQTLQHIQFAGRAADRPGLLMAYDGFVFAAATAAGVLLFRRKDLK